MQGSSKSSNKFNNAGADHLIKTNWDDPAYRRAVAAVLIQAVYIVDSENKSLASEWWTALGFNKIKDISDDISTIVFASVFEYKSPHGSTATNRAPEYVIAFRGTKDLHDIITDVSTLPLENLADANRVTKANACVDRLISDHGLRGPRAKRLWLAGHSLGASVAICVAVHLLEARFPAENFDTFLFNPPFPGFATTNDEKKKGVNQKFENMVGDLLKGYDLGTVAEEPWKRLQNWLPNLYVNSNDVICNGFIDCFEQDERGMRAGLAAVSAEASDGKVVTVYWKESKHKSLFLIPGGDLYVNRSKRMSWIKVFCNPGGSLEGLFRVHELKQWWKKYLVLEYQRHGYEEKQHVVPRSE